MDQLTDGITLGFSSSGGVGVRRAAQFLCALNIAVMDITGFFSELIGWSLQEFDPSFNGYIDAIGDRYIVLYDKRLEPEYPQKAVFLGSLVGALSASSYVVVIKFPSAYGKDAHELLARQSPPLAPKLWHCAWEEQVGTYAVVIQHIPRPAVCMLDVPEDELDTVVKRAHIESLRTAVATLHAHGWVFGDVREGNIFLPEDSVQLIDFDWCGKEGEARYPDDINLKSIEWHEGVSRGGLIKKEHDEYVLKKICDRYTFD